MTRTKKQHYIAQCLLKIFIKDSDLYESLILENKVYKTSFENSMCYNNTYESMFFKDNFLEDFFANNIDGMSAESNRKILQLIENGDDLEKIYICFFENVHYYLVNYYKSLTSLVRMGTEKSDVDNDSIKEMLIRILNKNYIKKLALILNKGYKFSVVHSTNGNFIMCDQYISTCSTKYKGQFVNISSRDIGIKDTIILFPINCDYYIVFYDNDLEGFSLKETEINILTAEQENIINQVIYNNAYKKVISNKKVILDNLAKTKNTLGDITATAKYSNGATITYKVKQEIFLLKKHYEFYDYYHSYKWFQNKSIKVNEKCSCGSDKKYKKCCKILDDECHIVLNNMRNNDKVMIFSKIGIEEPILMPAEKNLEMSKLYDELSNKK